MATGHRITVEPGTEHVRVVLEGRLIAESRRPLVLREAGCPVRYYLPPDDVRTELLTESATRTHCPFKGAASYWSVKDAADGLDVVWAYPEPKPEVAAITGHFCFYAAETVAEED
ncbi:DUF427 domain-containing protein [Streptomyces sp. SP18CS02]|uniref:DUF427 domain-containing protein n=1 Tax=Streptomyces sp. SP18CS02 TaxID=3002531 RepID=UPI002E7A01AD|nr:DUF427 domain-containing protein [Streptomyces sp. SP18CS02]MEE1757064.1 DUF427 domain-containing protein [Streptomyces sp. SP18CS02]